MRISDWSSDVCSSDLIRRIHRGIVAIGVHEVARRRVDFLACEVLEGVGQAPVAAGLAADPLRTPGIAAPARGGASAQGDQVALVVRLHDDVDHAGDRSEEHTSELQSLMRISYAVFCLQKKHKNNNKHHPTHLT